MGGGINTNMNLVGNLPTFYRTRHILPIRQRQIGDLVGDLPASLLHPNIFYV